MRLDQLALEHLSGATDRIRSRAESAGGAGAYCRGTEPFRLPLREIPMSDKSPRQGMTKKTGKSIKEKRADKRDKGSDDAFSDKIHPTKKK